MTWDEASPEDGRRGQGLGGRTGRPGPCWCYWASGHTMPEIPPPNIHSRRRTCLLEVPTNLNEEHGCMTRTDGFQIFLQSHRRQDSAVLAPGPQTDQWTRKESRTSTSPFGQLVVGKGEETSQWGKNHFFQPIVSGQLNILTQKNEIGSLSYIIYEH